MTIATSAWLDRFFDFYYARHPVSATFIGVHRQDYVLPDYSADGVTTTIAQARELLDMVDTGQVEQPENEWESIDRLLARNFLIIRIWELSDHRVHLRNPCVYTGEAIFGFISLFLRDYAPLDERVASATVRMRSIPELLDQGLANIDTAPQAWIERAINECTGAIALLTEGVDILMERYGVLSADFTLQILFLQYCKWRLENSLTCNLPDKPRKI